LKGFKKAMSEDEPKNEKDADFDAVEQKVNEAPLEQKETVKQSVNKD
jgi:Sec-independent protein translocase protein TatA